MAQDPFDLERFVRAQDEAGTYRRALAELRAGAKRSHWMWFVFPQAEGLGHSAMARTYAIGSAHEAAAYLRHPVLGPRLVECAEALLGLPGDDPTLVFGELDALKLRSSMTLFSAIAGVGSDNRDTPFDAVLDRYFAGVGDPATEAWLASGAA